MGDVNKTIWQSVAQQGKPVAYVLTFTSTLGYGALAQAQIMPDAVGADGLIRTSVTTETLGGGSAEIIRGDAIEGGNLFHSFSEFNVGENQRVYFENPVGVTDIFSRVTAGDGSSINGVLGVINPDLQSIGSANLFLLNPLGVVFGPGAQLELNGSFTASTATSITLPNGTTFDVPSTATDLLTFSTPLGVQFNAPSERGDITNNASNLAVAAGQTLTLFGDSLLNNGQLSAPSGTVEVVGDQFTLGSDASINTIGDAPGGAILVRADDIDLALGSKVSSGQTLTLFGDSLLNNGQLSAPSGTVEVVGNQFTLGSEASINTMGDAPGGDILVRADEIDFASGSTISGVGELVLQPLMLGTGVVLGGTTIPMDMVLDLTAEDLQAIENGGFSSILIGRDDLTGDIRLDGDVEFSDPLTLSTLGSITANESIDANGRTPTVTGSDNASLSLRAGAGIAAGAISTDGAPVSIDGDINRDGTGSVTVNQAISTDGGDLTIVGTSSTIAGGIVTLVPIDTGAGNITLVTDNPVLGSTISGTGELQILPFSPALTINLGEGGDSNLSFLNQAEINRLNGFSGITIGSDTFVGAIELVADVAFNDPTTLRTTGTIDTTNGVLTGIGNASFLLQAAAGIETGDIDTVASGGDIILVSDGEISTNGFLRSGNNLEFRTLTGISSPVVNVNSPLFSATSDIVLGDYTGPALKLETTGNIEVGNIRITGQNGALTADGTGSDNDLLASSRAAILRAGLDDAVSPPSSITVSSVNTFNADGGDGGPIILAATGDVRTPSDVFGSFDSSSSMGNGGDISITSTTGSIDLAFISLNASSFASAESPADGGAITIDAESSIDISSSTLNASSFASAGDSGNGGAITIDAEENIILDGGLSLISSSSAFNSFDERAVTVVGDSGDGGPISINAGGDISAALGTFGVVQLSSSSSSEEGQAGAGGAISINADNDIIIPDSDLELFSNSSISSEQANSGNGGSILIEAGRNIDTRSIFNIFNSSSFSNSGNIFIKGASINISGTVDPVARRSDEQTGNVTIESTAGDIVLDGSTILADAHIDGGNAAEISIAGNGGGVRINNSSISASSPEGSAGKISIVNSVGGVELNASSISANTTGENGGEIQINAEFLSLQNESDLSANFGGEGEANGISITTTGINRFGDLSERVGIFLDNSDISAIVEPEAVSTTGGTVAIRTDSLAIQNGGRIQTQTRGTTNAGNVELEIDRSLNIQGFNNRSRVSGIDVSSISTADDGGAGGSIRINTPETARGTVTIANNGFLNALASGDGKAGDIQVNVESLRLETGGKIIAASESVGNAGSIEVNATEQVLIDGQGVTLTFSSPFTGEAAPTPLEFNAIANANDFEVEDFQDASFANRLNQQGDGNFAYFSFSVTEPNSRGVFDIDNAANTEIESNIDTELFLFDQTTGALLERNDDSSIDFGGEGSQSDLDSFINFNFGASGGYVIGVAQFGVDVVDGGVLSGESAPQAGQTYDLRVSLQNANEGIFEEESIFAGDGNTLTPLTFDVIPDENFEGLEDASFSARVGEEGNGSFAYYSFQVAEPNSEGTFDIDNGTIDKLDTELFLFDQSTGELLATNDDNNDTTTELLGGEGESFSVDSLIDFTFNEPGDYVIGVGQFDSDVANGELITGNAPSPGQTYDLRVSLENAAGGAVNVAGGNPNPNLGVNSGLFAQTLNTTNLDAGDGGSVVVNANQLSVTNGAEILVSTLGSGTGGDIQLNTNEINLDNNGRIAASTSGSGAGGNIDVRNINDGILTIQGSGRLEVDAAVGPNVGTAGQLTINGTSTVALRKGVTISAENNSLEEGGNITIAAGRNVVTAGGSLIDALSSNPAGGRGGNIDISAGQFFVTLSTGNNDIIANAVGGDGGVITLSAERIFGLLERRGVDAETLRNNILSEVSASSTAGGIDGEVTLLNLSFDPTQGLNQLPVDLTDQANQIAQGCRANSSGLASETDQSEFVITGRGGLPASPSDSISAGLDSVPWVTAPDGDSPSVSPEPTTSSAVKPLLEAQGWTTRADGEIFFVADATTTTAPQLSGLPTASLCSASL